MRRLRTLAAAVLVGLVAVSCGSQPAPIEVEATDSQTDPAAMDSAEPTLAYLAAGEAGLVRVDAESGGKSSFIDFVTLGVSDADSLIVRGEEDLWVATGPGRVARVAASSGVLIGVTEFRSTQRIVDFEPRGGLLWVLAGEPYVDAVLLGIDRVSGQLVFNLEPPPGGELGALAVGDDAIWVIGGSPISDRAISRIDPGSGRLDGTFEVGGAVQLIAAGAGAVWVADFGPDVAKSTLRKIDPMSGALLGMLPLQLSAETLEVAGGAVWVGGTTSTAGAADSASSSGGAGSARIATVLRVDPAALAISDVFEVGRAGAGPDVIAAHKHLLAVNHENSRIYWIDPVRRSLRGTLAGPLYPLLVLE